MRDKKNFSVRKFKKKSSNIFFTLVIWFLGLSMVFPFVWMVSASFKTQDTVFSYPIEWIPKDPTLKNYKLLFSGDVPFFQFYKNSIIVLLLSLVGVFFACGLAGYAYAKIRFAWRDKLFLLKLATTMLPGIVTLLPTFLIYSKLGLIDSLTALWLPNLFGGAFGVFIMRQSFMSLPDGLIEAARIDGANHWQVYWRVALPNVKPSMTTVLLMYSIWTWNAYEGPLLYLRSEINYTLPFAVKYFADEQYQNYPAIMAANVVMLVPLIILFFVCQKQFVRSIVGSSVKG